MIVATDLQPYAHITAKLGEKILFRSRRWRAIDHRQLDHFGGLRVKIVGLSHSALRDGLRSCTGQGAERSHHRRVRQRSTGSFPIRSASGPSRHLRRATISSVKITLHVLGRFSRCPPAATRHRDKQRHVTYFQPRVLVGSKIVSTAGSRRFFDHRVQSTTPDGSKPSAALLEMAPGRTPRHGPRDR